MISTQGKRLATRKEVRSPLEDIATQMPQYQFANVQQALLNTQQDGLDLIAKFLQTDVML